MFKRTLFVSLALIGLVVAADAASACDQQCQNVGPGFCRRCIDTGTYTGATCQNSGSCGCFYTQNTCGLFAAGGPAEAEALPFAEIQTPAAPAEEATVFAVLAD